MIHAFICTIIISFTKTTKSQEIAYIHHKFWKHTVEHDHQVYEHLKIGVFYIQHQCHTLYEASSSSCQR